MKPYPIQFAPVFKEKVWGGRELERFGFELPEGPIGEAWMLGDHPHGITKAVNGPLQGMGLDQIRQQYGSQLFGTKNNAALSRFPLMLKLLDCKDDLSVQVHPNDHYDRLPPGELGKTEMWYVLDAKPGAKIIYGLREQFSSREAMMRLIEEGKIMEGLKEIEVKKGDSFYIPAGTVHALCKGVLVAEIQQNSDTTYRLYDYDRPGLDGELRELHIEDSLNVISYSGAQSSYMHTDDSTSAQWLTLAKSEYFVVEKGCVDSVWEMETSSESFVLHLICEGEGELQWEDGSIAVQPGSCFLLPANLGKYRFVGKLTMLRAQLG